MYIGQAKQHSNTQKEIGVWIQLLRWYKFLYMLCSGRGIFGDLNGLLGQNKRVLYGLVPLSSNACGIVCIAPYLYSPCFATNVPRQLIFKMNFW